jgi:hypothetical protein
LGTALGILLALALTNGVPEVDLMRFTVKVTRVIELSTLVEVEAEDAQKAQVCALNRLRHPDFQDSRRHWGLARETKRVNYVKDSDGKRVLP